DVLRKGGARLREVGTTNRTRLADYSAALSPDTALLLKVHPSNFRIVGFTETPARAELVGLARSARVPFVEDLGSGLITPLAGSLEDEPVVARVLQEGVDLVTFSGDKLLGGPQAGRAVGRRALVDALRRNPLYRALRVDKMTVAALDAVLAEHEAGRAAATVPVLAMLAASAEQIRARAEAFVQALQRDAAGLHMSLLEGSSAVGGGAAPDVEVPTVLVAVGPARMGREGLAAARRAGSPPVMARVAGDRLLLDLRTVRAEEEPILQEALRRAAAGPA